MEPQRRFSTWYHWQGSAGNPPADSQCRVVSAEAKASLHFMRSLTYRNTLAQRHIGRLYFCYAFFHDGAALAALSIAVAALDKAQKLTAVFKIPKLFELHFLT